MKKEIYLSLFLITLFGCTLSEDEFSISPPADNITVNLFYNTTGDEGESRQYWIEDNNGESYIKMVLSDTTDLYHQKPLYVGRKNQFTLPKDTIRKGVWLMIKKWCLKETVNDRNVAILIPGTVYESKPLFLSIQVPEEAKEVSFKMDQIITLIKREILYEIDSVHINIHNFYDIESHTFFSWDSKFLDGTDPKDSTDILPDIYCGMDDYLISEYPGTNDQPLGWYTFKFNKPVKLENYNLIFNCYDHDFNSSEDELMYSIWFNSELKITDNQDGFSKSLRFDGFYQEYSINGKFPGTHLYLKSY